MKSSAITHTITLIIGFIIGYIFCTTFNKYEIECGDNFAVKLDKSSGKTWYSFSGMSWSESWTTNEPKNQNKTWIPPEAKQDTSGKYFDPNNYLSSSKEKKSNLDQN